MKNTRILKVAFLLGLIAMVISVGRFLYANSVTDEIKASIFYSEEIGFGPLVILTSWAVRCWITFPSRHTATAHPSIWRSDTVRNSSASIQTR